MNNLVITPNYVNIFSCIGPKCEDSCCNDWGIYFDKKTYKKIVKKENDNKKNQSISNICASPEKPINEFIAIIIKDVPTAFFISKPAQSTNAGTYRNPPPAPIKPVIVPIIIPWIKVL